MGCYAGRIRRVLLAWTASAAVLFASAGPLLAEHLAVDRECAPGLVQAHDHAAHRLSQSPDPAPDHCVACHLTRSVRHASFSQTSLPLGVLDSATAEPDARVPNRADLRTDLTRGPPR